MNTRLIRLSALLLAALSLAALAFAGVPQTINYQGYLKNADNTPVNTPVNVIFRLYSSTSGVGAIWAGPPQNVIPVNGVYSTQIVPTSLPFDRQYWLGVTIAGEELRPLQQLDAVPYALRAAVADSVNISPGQYKYSVSGPATINYNGSLKCICDSSIADINCSSSHYSLIDVGPLCYDVYISGGYDDYDLGWIDEYSGVPYARGIYTPLLAIGPYGGIGINTGAPMYDLDVSGTARATKFLGDGSGITAITGSNISGNISGNAANITGVVAANHGGTGIVSQPTASGQYLRSTAAGAWGIGTIQAGDLPDLSSTYTPAAAPVQIPRTNTITSIDNAGDVGQYNSITIGTDGYPVISYYDATLGNLKVAKCGNATCSVRNTITTIDSGGDVGQYTSIAIGADGFPVISFYDVTNANLKVAKCGNAACSSGNSIAIVDSTGDVGKYNSIAIGTDGFPVIAYKDATNNITLKAAKCGNAACTAGNTFTVIDAPVHSWHTENATSIAIGIDAKPVISYNIVSNNGAILEMRVAICGNAACSSGNTIKTISAWKYYCKANSIVIGPDGTPVIVFANESGDAENGIFVANCSDTSCTNVTTNYISYDTSPSLSITIGADGFPVINFGPAIAKCLDRSCSQFRTIVVESVPTDYSAVTIGTDGLPVISYHDSTSGDLKVAKCANQFCINNWSRR